jgi:hypothetical protein
MKTRILLMSLVTVFFMSCSNSESDAPQKSAKQLAFEKQAQELVRNPEFRNAITEHYNSDLMRDGNPDQGAFVIDNNSGSIYGFPLGGSRFLLCGASDTNGTITFLPNGTARFNTRSNEPLAFILDFNTFATELSNDADVDKAGSMFSNVVSNYVLVNFGFGDLYFQTEPVSGSVFRLNTTISDSQPLFDENWIFIGFSPETVRKSVSVRVVSPPNGDGNGSFDVQIN